MSIHKINKIIELIVESYKIPDDMRNKIRKRSVRVEMRRKYGDKAFLDPDNLAFPVVNPDTGEYDCRLIYAAYLRAKLFEKKGSTKHSRSYYSDIKNKALKLYRENKCYDELKIKIHEEDYIDIKDFFYLLIEDDEGYVEDILTDFVGIEKWVIN